jgi:hypothetical protein
MTKIVSVVLFKLLDKVIVDAKVKLDSNSTKLLVTEEFIDKGSEL